MNKTFLGRPKSDWYYSYKIARLHQYFAWILFPYFLIALFGCIFTISQGNLPGFIISKTFVIILGWVNYIGFKCIYTCKKAGIDYLKAWNEV